MNQTRFTPGRWVAGFGHQHYFRVYAGSLDGPIVANTSVEGGVTTVQEANANAQLISAAPDMYAALNELLLYGNPPNPAEGDTEQERGEREYRAVMMSLAALAKARGEVQP